MREHVDRRFVLLEHAADVEHRHAVGEPNGFVDVVRHEHDRLVQPALEVQQLLLQTQPHDRIDRAERLVHQQHRRIGGERAPTPTRCCWPPESSVG